MKRFLFVLAKPPHSGAYCQETLDMILTTAAFDQEVALLLLDDGIFQLKTRQQVIEGTKDTAAIFKALELYDVTNIFVEHEAFKERGLTIDDLLLPARLCRRQEVSALIQQFDVVLA